MKQYHNLLQDILTNGTTKSDRTNTGTISIFGAQLRFDLQKGFPLLTTKKMATKAIISELLWFLEGSTDERRLAEIHYQKPREELIGKQTIWTANADKQGKDLGYTNTDTIKDLGPVYGEQWRFCGYHRYNGAPIDQIAEVIYGIKHSPDSRRHIISAWNIEEIGSMALPPCHYAMQFYVVDNKLSCMFNMRSTDAFLGLPFNIASYALLTMMIANICDLQPGELIYTGGDVHIYSNHITQVQEQLLRDPDLHPLPRMLFRKHKYNSIDEFTMNDFNLIDYKSYPPIKASMAV